MLVHLTEYLEQYYSGFNVFGYQTMRAIMGALTALQQSHRGSLPGQLRAFGIQGDGLGRLFMSHPPIEERIAALQARADRV